MVGSLNFSNLINIKLFWGQYFSWKSLSLFDYIRYVGWHLIKQWLNFPTDKMSELTSWGCYSSINVTSLGKSIGYLISDNSILIDNLLKIFTCFWIILGSRGAWVKTSSTQYTFFGLRDIIFGGFQLLAIIDDFLTLFVFGSFVVFSTPNSPLNDKS